MKSTITGTVSLLAILTCAATGAAQTSGDDSVKFVGEVTGSAVFVVSAPRAGAYTCTMVRRGQKVKVVSTHGQWHRIRPVIGCYSAVKRSAVTYDRTNDIGTVVLDKAWVYAGGDRRDSLGEYSESQGYLPRHTTVRVIGQTREFYKIPSPSRAPFYIEARYVRMPDSEAAGPATATHTPAPVAVTPVGREQGPVEPMQTPEAVALDEPLAKAEKKLQAEFDKPAAQRDLQALLETYRQLHFPEGSGQRSLVEYRTAFLTSAIRHEQHRQDMDRLLRDAAEARRRMETIDTKVRTQIEAAQAEPEYAVTGLLQRSRVYRGRYSIHDPETLGVRAYVQLVRQDMDIAGLLGQVVGVYGEAQPRQTSGISLINARQIVAIGSGAAISLPEPTVIYEPPAAVPPAAVPAPIPPTPEMEPEPDPEPEQNQPSSPQEPVEPTTPAAGDFPALEQIATAGATGPAQQPETPSVALLEMRKDAAEAAPAPDANEAPADLTVPVDPDAVAHTPAIEPDEALVPMIVVDANSAEATTGPAAPDRVPPADAATTQPAAGAPTEVDAATPATAPAGPTTRPAPVTGEASPPPLLKLLPETGLPMASPSDAATVPVNEEEYE